MPWWTRRSASICRIGLCHETERDKAVIRHRVSLAGKVTRLDGTLLRSGTIQLVDSDTTVRIATIRNDGQYFFLDLPAGKYVVQGVADGGRSLEPRAVTIAPGDAGGGTTKVDYDFNLQIATDGRGEKPRHARRGG